MEPIKGQGRTGEITDLEKENILKHLQMIAPVVPANMYWFDLNNKVLGTNQLTVDAMENKEGEICLKLTSDNEWVKITVQDNGKGISSALIEKINNSIAVTEGKKEGHGLGLMQVREMLDRNQGNMCLTGLQRK